MYACTTEDGEIQNKFERERFISLREGGFSYCTIAAHVQRNSNANLKAVDRRGTEQLETLQVDNER